MVFTWRLIGTLFQIHGGVDVVGDMDVVVGYSVMIHVAEEAETVNKSA